MFSAISPLNLNSPFKHNYPTQQNLPVDTRRFQVNVQHTRCTTATTGGDARSWASLRSAGVLATERGSRFHLSRYRVIAFRRRLYDKKA